MKISREPYIYSSNKYKLAADKLAIKAYRQLSPPLKKAATQVGLKDYLEREGLNSTAALVKRLAKKVRRRFSDPTKIDEERYFIEVNSGYWYKLENGQPISRKTTTFFVNGAIGMRSLIGCDLSFWKTLNQSITISFSAYILPIELRKQIFVKHRFSKSAAPSELAGNIKRLYVAQLENLYNLKSIDSLQALIVLYIAHHLRSGKPQSQKVELYVYAQFLFLMAYKYKIKNIEELYVHVNYLLVCNSIYKEEAENRLINFDQLNVDCAVVGSLTKSVKTLPKKQQEKVVSQKIMTYLNEQIHHPLFHAYSN